MHKVIEMSESEFFVKIGGVIDASQPTETDLIMDASLRRYLSNLSLNGEPLFETDHGNAQRREACDKLQAIVREWVTKIGKDKGVSDEFLDDGGGAKLYIFGSQRLGVHNSASDIDSLCVFPSHVSREDFFTRGVSFLQECPDISLLLPIPEAYTPVVKFQINEYSVDMLMVTLPCQKVPSDLDILDASWLKGQDEQGVRSLNGPRVAESILNLVPNQEVYANALRVIKYWARQRGLYSNVLGFLGGVNFAILVAFVCQRYPNACPAVLVLRFFNLFCQWRWPAPILLAPLDDPSEEGSRLPLLPVWNPKVDAKDLSHIMPIITPAYPAMNSAYNIGAPQFRLIQEEIQRAQAVCYRELSRAAQEGAGAAVSSSLWEVLLASSAREFFDRHPRFVQVDLVGNTAEKHRMWFGWCESRMRQLFLSLECPPHLFSYPIATVFHREIPQPIQAPELTLPGGQLDISSHPDTTDMMEEKATGDLDDLSAALPSDTATDTSSPSIASRKAKKDVANNSPSSPQATKLATSSSSSSSEIVLYSSSFFVGLAFSPMLPQLDISLQIRDFCFRISHWAKHQSGMDVQLSMHTNATIPAFVRHEDTIKAPAGVSGCTPKRMRSRRNSSLTTSPMPGTSPVPSSPRTPPMDLVDLMFQSRGEYDSEDRSVEASTPVKG